MDTMPYNFQYTHKHIPPDLDRRRKIPVTEHENIRKRYAKGESQRELARAYNVSRRLIVFILHPERLKGFQERRAKEKYSQKYYHEHMKGERWRDTMRKHRLYRQSIKDQLVLSKHE